MDVGRIINWIRLGLIAIGALLGALLVKCVLW